MPSSPALPPSLARLRGPGDLVAAVPLLIGYRPRDAWVAVCLEPNGRLIATLSGPLPASPRAARDHERGGQRPPPTEAAREAGERAAACDVAERIRASEATSAALVVFSSAGGQRGGGPESRAGRGQESGDGFGDIHRRPRLPASDFAGAVADFLAVEGVLLLDALLVIGDRRWSYLCRNEKCCPTSGVPLANDVTEAVGLLAAEQTLLGRSPLASREELVASIAPLQVADTGPPAESSHASADGLAPDPEAPGPGAAGNGEDPASARRLFLGLLDRVASGDGGVRDTEAGPVVRRLRSIPDRDEVLLAAVADPVRAVPLLIQLARRTRPPGDAPVCSVLACAAYASGDGALANVALDRALASDPSYSLALLTRGLLDRQVHPSRLRGMLTASATR